MPGPRTRAGLGVAGSPLNLVIVGEAEDPALCLRGIGRRWVVHQPALLRALDDDDEVVRHGDPSGSQILPAAAAPGQGRTLQQRGKASGSPVATRNRPISERSAWSPTRCAVTCAFSPLPLEQG